MVGKGKSISHGSNGIDYALNKDRAEVIDKNLVHGNNGAEIKNEFKMFQDMNTRCKNNDLSFVISPNSKDGKPLTEKQWKEISDDFMKKINLENHQYICVKHNPIGENKTPHLHIIANRIDENGKAHSDKYIGKKAQRVANEIAKERGFIQAKEIGLNQEILNKENLKEIRQQIYNKHNEVMKLGKPKDFNEYMNQMNTKGVKVKPTLNKKGAIQGFRVKYQDFDLKATQVHRNMSLSRTGLKTSMPKLNSLKTPKPLEKPSIDGLLPTKIRIKLGKELTKKIIRKGLSY